MFICYYSNDIDYIFPEFKYNNESIAMIRGWSVVTEKVSRIDHTNKYIFLSNETIKYKKLESFETKVELEIFYLMHKIDELENFQIFFPEKIKNYKSKLQNYIKNYPELFI